MHLLGIHVVRLYVDRASTRRTITITVDLLASVYLLSSDTSRDVGICGIRNTFPQSIAFTRAFTLAFTIALFVSAIAFVISCLASSTHSCIWRTTHITLGSTRPLVILLLPRYGPQSL